MANYMQPFINRLSLSRNYFLSRTKGLLNPKMSHFIDLEIRTGFHKVRSLTVMKPQHPSKTWKLRAPETRNWEALDLESRI